MRLPPLPPSSGGILDRHSQESLSLRAFGPCFVAGVMAYTLLGGTRVRKLPGWTWPLLLALCTPLFLLLDTDAHPSYRGWLFCVAVGACITVVCELSPSCATRTASVVATYSYGIYLTHVAAISIAFVWLNDAPVAGRFVAFAILLVGLPFLAYHLIEQPMITLGTRISERFRERNVVEIGAAATASPP